MEVNLKEKVFSCKFLLLSRKVWRVSVFWKLLQLGTEEEKGKTQNPKEKTQTQEKNREERRKKHGESFFWLTVFMAHV